MGTWVHRLIKFGVWGLGASVWGVGFRVAGLGFAIGSCAGIHCSRIMREHLATILQCRKEDARLPGKGDLNFHGARPVHLIITMTRRIRTSRLSTKNSRSCSGNAGCAAQICQLLCRTVTGLTRSVSPKTLNERERERENVRDRARETERETETDRETERRRKGEREKGEESEVDLDKTVDELKRQSLPLRVEPA